MSKQSFCEKNIWLKNQPISFAGRPYLPTPYASTARKLVIRASRQVEKTTFLINSIIYEAVKHPGIHILFVARARSRSVYSAAHASRRRFRTVHSSGVTSLANP